MTRSIFDPTGPDAEQGRGNNYLGEQGINRSHMPESLQPETSEEKSLEGAGEAQNSDEAAERLEQLEEMTPQEVDAQELPDEEK